MTSRSLATAAAAAALLVLAAGCSSDDGDKSGDGGAGAQKSHSTGTPTTTSATPSSEPSAEPPRKCSDVWVVGKVLPEGYAGCTLPGGKLHADEGYDCVDGSTLYAFDDPRTGDETMYGITGKPIGSSLKITDQYAKDFETCAG